MDVNEFDYDLPEKLIAQKPAQKRDESRLLCLNHKTGAIAHNSFIDIISYLEKGDLLVINNSRVIPARLYGKKIPTGTEVEFLLLNELESDHWEVLVKPGRRLKKGTSVSFGDHSLIAYIEDYTDFGGRVVKFEYSGDFKQLLQQLGEMPLPPYIHRQPDNPERYQTVYAREEGSVAAPTAGLHFTEKLLQQIRDRGISIVDITLHVGLGTFRPVRVDKVEEHEMHAEYYQLTPQVAEKINQTARSGGRIVAVGTTVTRTLEAMAVENNRVASGKGWTDLFIYPGYHFKIVKALITNFHLPRSTLLMLISALAGKETVLQAYQEAIKHQYRFYSFGDAMFIY